MTANVELLRTSTSALPFLKFEDLCADSDDTLSASLLSGTHVLVLHVANLGDAEEDGFDAHFACDLSNADDFEKSLAESLVRHLHHYRLVREREAELLHLLSEAQTRVGELEQQNAALTKTIFGVSSEKRPTDGEGAADGFAEPEPPTVACQTHAHPKHVRTVKGAGRKPLPPELPRDDVECDITAEHRFCPECHGSLKDFGTEISERLKVIPAQYRVQRLVRHRYACVKCQRLVYADMPKTMVPGGTYATAEFLAHVASSRFQFGLPYFRLEAMLQQAGLNVTRTTLANAMIRCAPKLSPLMAVFREELLSQTIIHADETRMQVLHEPGRAAEAQSYLWQYRSGHFAQRPVVYFDYQETRAGEHPKRFLAPEGGKGFRGWLQVDGYAGYNAVPGIKRVGCMAHVRRKFVSALEVLPRGSQESSEAARALEMIGKLYAIERKLSDQPPKRRLEVRQSESKPILKEFGDWLEDMKAKTLPKTLLGRAVGYAVDQWPFVSRYIEDGQLAIDNNISEREIKAVVIGRKNWLFADSPEGAYANAVFYTLVGTASANGLNPQDYLRHVFHELPSMTTAAQVETLAPWNCRALIEQSRQVA